MTTAGADSSIITVDVIRSTLQAVGLADQVDASLFYQQLELQLSMHHDQANVTPTLSSTQTMDEPDVLLPDTNLINDHNRNPTGRNQYMNCPRRDDKMVADALIDYHRRNITNRKIISELLLADYGISMSQATVARRRKELKLYGSGITTRSLSETQKRQLVLDQMSNDPTRRQGPRTVKQMIAKETGVHLTRDYIRSEMQKHEPDGFILRQPSRRRFLGRH